jgi:hypothetical protein
VSDSLLTARLRALRCLFGVSGGPYDDRVVRRTYGTGRENLPNQQNLTQMQFIVGVNVRGHTVEGTKSPTVCNFRFYLE